MDLTRWVPVQNPFAPCVAMMLPSLLCERRLQLFPPKHWHISSSLPCQGRGGGRMSITRNVPRIIPLYLARAVSFSARFFPVNRINSPAQASCFVMLLGCLFGRSGALQAGDGTYERLFWLARPVVGPRSGGMRAKPAFLHSPMLSECMIGPS